MIRKIKKTIQFKRLIKKVKEEILDSKTLIRITTKEHARLVKSARKGLLVDYDDIFLREDILRNRKERLYVLKNRQQLLESIWSKK